MKKIALLIVFIISGLLLQAQCSVKIYTRLKAETSQFIVWVNGEQQDAYVSDSFFMDNMLPGKYTFRVGFDADTIADCVKTINLKKNMHCEYEVVALQNFGKDARKVGRGFGRMTGNTGEDEAENLVQCYRLKKIK